MPEVGEEAPDFTLRDQDNQPWTLSEHRGRNVVLVFYPWSFSGICTSELHSLTDTADRFDAAAAEVVGISIDSRHVQRAFKQHEGLAATLLADFQPRGEVAQRYGVYIEEVGVSNRGTFVIDKDGRIAYKVVTSIGEGRDTEAYLTALESCPV
ncbi:MAG: peroxiredoxin [Candidatus Dormiibacterota bacterium]